jgi:hypothetical protein
METDAATGIVDVSFTISEADAMRMGMRQVYWRLALLAGLTVLFVVSASHLIASGGTSYALWTGIFAIAFPLLMFASARRNLRRAYRSATHLHGVIRAQLGDFGTRFTYAVGGSESAWAGYQRWFETRDMIVLMISTQQSRMIPKRALGEQHDALVKLLTAKLGKANPSR